jgi:hypothetical protein
MVRKAQFNKSCNACGSDLICPKCGAPSKTGTPFSQWLRNTNIRASCHDIDYVWHNYQKGWFITIEEKTHNGKSSSAQLETQAVIFQMLRASSGRKCLTGKGWHNIEYRGHYTIVFSNTTPDNGSFTINNIPSSPSELKHLLKHGHLERKEK